MVVRTKAGPGVPKWPRIGGVETLTEQAYRAVRRRLVDGHYAPGAFIREPELCEGMGVSRTPIREALNRLASEGFVERIPHRGFRVPDQALETLLHVFPVLGALEVLAGELAFPKLGAAELAQLEEANELFAAAIAANDVTEAVRWNEEFHRRLSRWSGNPILCEMLDDLRAQVRRLEAWDFIHLFHEGGGGEEGARDVWPRQHGEIIAAVRAGEFDLASALLRGNRSLFFVHEIDQILDARSSKADA
jgi:DNA-binding GntR family transcriptional regulator